LATCKQQARPKGRTAPVDAADGLSTFRTTRLPGVKEIDEYSASNRLAAMTVATIAALLVTMTTTIVNVALPEIGRDLQSPRGISWIVSAYLLAVAVSQLVSGWVADRFGKKRTLSVSLALFAASSLLCAFAPSLSVLVAFRILQGASGGALMPVGMAMVYDIFPPHRRGTALGIWGIAAFSGPAIGPVIGGWIVTAASWRWVFVVLVPIAVVGVLLSVFKLEQVGFREERELDWRGFMLASIGLTLVVVSLEPVQDGDAGSPTFFVLAAAGFLCLALFVRRDLTSRSPLLHLRMLAVPRFANAMAIWCLLSAAQFARLVVIPVNLQTVYGLDALAAGLLLAIPALATAAANVPGGRIADRIGPRIPVVLGLGLIAIVLWNYAHLTPDTSRSTILVLLTVEGIGYGLAMMPVVISGMNSLATQYTSRASAVRAVLRQMAGSLGTVLLVSVVIAQIGSLTGEADNSSSELQSAYNRAYKVALFVVIAAIPLAMRLPRGTESFRIQAETRDA
jgi:EmrB/QacA subfamily drug resistance transporter